jgi:hypothetical protein
MILLSSGEDINDPPGRIEKALDSDTGQAYLPIVVEDIRPRRVFQPQ